MQEHTFKKIICRHTAADCPYHLEHCWLGEIDEKSLNESVPLTSRLPCRKKKSRKVICTLGVA